MAVDENNNKFATLRIAGPEGMVRGYFMARDLSEPASQAIFPGVKAVAILPREFTSEDEAVVFLSELLEPGGNAGAAQVGKGEWLIGAWLPI